MRMPLSLREAVRAVAVSCAIRRESMPIAAPRARFCTPKGSDRMRQEAPTHQNPLVPGLHIGHSDLVERPIAVDLSLGLDVVARVGEEICIVERDNGCASRASEPAGNEQMQQMAMQHTQKCTLGACLTQQRTLIGAHLRLGQCCGMSAEPQLQIQLTSNQSFLPASACATRKAGSMCLSCGIPCPSTAFALVFLRKSRRHLVWST